jgi:signal transduction histidine kinase
VELVFDDGTAMLRVRDRGVGFDAAARRRPESFGLASLREEVEALGGSLAVASAPGAGTELQIRLPLASSGGGP